MSDRVYIGIDIGGTNLKLALISEAGEVLSKTARPSSSDGGPEGLRRGLAEAVSSVAGGKVVSDIGIGCAGVLSADRRSVQASPNLPEIEGLPLCDSLESEFGVETLLENDANAIALGEFWRGAGAGTRTLVVITLGTGVGTGFILDGVLWRGGRGLGAEGGHTTIDPEGPRCHCGNRGCLEAFVGAYAILGRLEDRLSAGRGSALKAGVEHTVEEISEAARRGDETALAVLAETGRRLGVGLANFANLFNPDRIVVTGGVSRAGRAILGPAEEEMKRRAFRAVTEGLEVAPGQLGDDAGPLGAVYPLIERAGGRR
ncbi:MAG: ROK family protein [Nitrospinota bacterium]